MPKPPTDSKDPLTENWSVETRRGSSKVAARTYSDFPEKKRR